jgi:hypothetical protein
VVLEGQVDAEEVVVAVVAVVAVVVQVVQVDPAVTLLHGISTDHSLNNKFIAS